MDLRLARLAHHLTLWIFYLDIESENPIFKSLSDKVGATEAQRQINDANVARNNKAYAKACNAISASEIESILKTFDIAAQPFAKIVGLGEITVNRYLNGRTPSKSISDKTFHWAMGSSAPAFVPSPGPTTITTGSDPLSSRTINGLSYFSP